MRFYGITRANYILLIPFINLHTGSYAASRHSWFIELVQLRFPPVAGNTGPMMDSPYWTLGVREKSLELAIYRLRFPIQLLYLHVIKGLSFF